MSDVPLYQHLAERTLHEAAQQVHAQTPIYRGTGGEEQIGVTSLLSHRMARMARQNAYMSLQQEKHRLAAGRLASPRVPDDSSGSSSRIRRGSSSSGDAGYHIP